MKKYILTVLSCFFILFFSYVVFAQEKQYSDDQFESINEEYVEKMDIQAQINPDASVSVIEEINYNFGNQEKHGIFRTIPLGFTPKGETGHTEIKVQKVTDELGNEYQFDITSNDPINIKIGDPNNTITGEHTYKIYYILKKSIGYFDSYDEWYWNLTGNDWNVPIAKLSATIILPNKVINIELKLRDYCGFKDETKSCGTFSQKDEQTVSYVMNPSSILEAGEGSTIAVGFPKGFVAVPTKIDLFLAWFSRVWFFPFPFILAYFWFRKRLIYILKRQKYFKRNTIIPEYDAGIFTPLEGGLLVNKKVELKDISAVIVSLAISGYLKIEEKDGEFCFKKLKDTSSDMIESEKLVLESLDNICESNLGDSQSTNFLNAIAQADSRLIARDYIVGSVKNKFRGTTKNFPINIVLPLFLAVNPGIFIWIILGVWAGFIFSGFCILVGIMNLFMKKSTIILSEKGFEAERKLLGLKLYIRIAEEERIKFANAPAKTPELFEKLLPYAMIFGLERKWAKEFESIYKINPSWYNGNTLAAFSAIAFMNSINSFHMSVDRAIASNVPSTSSLSWSSSSGGSSGGGSSGGGGGGGGGGSW